MKNLHRNALCLFFLGALAVPHVAAQQAPEAKTLTEADARTQFAQRDAARTQAKPDTHERAQAAQQASGLASVIAWDEFDAAHYDEAAAWFARHDALDKEYYQNEITYQETVRKAEIDKTQAGLEPAFGRWRAQLAAETDPQKKETMQNVVDGVPSTRYALPRAFVSQMEQLATGAGDRDRELKYKQQDLALEQAQLKDMSAAGLPTEKINTQRAAVATATARVGGAYETRDDEAQARKYYDEALGIRQALPADLPERGLEVAYSDLGGLYKHLGELPAARDQYRLALQALQDSEPVYQKALAAPPPPEYKGLDAKTVEGYMNDRHQEMIVERAMRRSLAFNNIGIITADLGDYTAALSDYQQSLQALDAMPAGDLFDIYKALMRAKTMGNIAALHADSGLIDQALAEEKQVIEANRALGESVAAELNNAAGWYQEKGDAQTARAYLLQARQSFQADHNLRGVVGITLALASLDYDAGRYAESESGARQALTIAQQTGDLGWQGAATRHLAAVAWKTGHLDAADALLTQAEAIDKQVGAPLDAEYTFDLQGRVRESRGDLNGALAKFQQAIKLIENVRNTASSPADFSNKKDTYRTYERIVRLLIKMGRPDDAFDYFNRSQSKQLQDLLNASAAKTGDPTLQALLDRKKALLVKRGANAAQLQAEQSKPAAQRDPAKISNLQGALAATDKEYGRVVATLQGDPSYKKVISIDPFRLRRMQTKLPANVALVEYAPLGDQLYIFLVTQNALKIYTPTVALPDLWKRIAETRAQLLTPDSKLSRGGGGQRAGRAVEDNNAPVADAHMLDENLTALYDTLLGPI
ncbi:MAG: tetratricopeptide repeat protein, partial [Armatimonadota bacterium]|nr:tetratricopeptide repeat protein [Armatimonadota bacterium]